MKLDKNDILQRLSALSSREQWLAVGGSIFVIFYGLYLMVYEPIAREKTQLDHKIYAQQLLFQQLTHISKHARSLRDAQQQTMVAVNGQSLMAIVETSSTELGIKTAIKSMRPEGDDTMTIVAEDIAFDPLVYWLAILENKHAIKVIQLSIKRNNDKAGLVDAQITLISGQA